LAKGNNVCVFDKYTYCSNYEALKNFDSVDQLDLVVGDLSDQNLLLSTILRVRPNFVINFAAETHVDKSIIDPSAFMYTNIIGTYNILEALRKSVDNGTLSSDCFLLHVSTDEVYGSADHGETFVENSPYAPNSPYSASKASSDHLVRAWNKTFGLNVITTNCANNYGPFQYPDKLVSLTIKNLMEGLTIPVYGNGLQVRNWIFVADHVDALNQLIARKDFGETYNIGSAVELTNIELIKAAFNAVKACGLLAPSFRNLDSAPIKFVTDRPGHDKRYSISSEKLRLRTGWEEKETIDLGLMKNVRWIEQNKNYSWGSKPI
jgi:dTDP-glucose 4,6-dehydratase